MPAPLYRLRAIPSVVIRKLTYAEPPGRLPRGYFDTLHDPTKQLLAKGFRLAQAAAWLIQQGALPVERREQYLDAMRARFSRFRRQSPKPAAVYQWQATLGYEAAHAIAGGVKALCGATSARWFASGDGQRRCNQCTSIIRRENVTIHRGN
jgi:hypothetical protein